MLLVTDPAARPTPTSSNMPDIPSAEETSRLDYLAVRSNAHQPVNGGSPLRRAAALYAAEQERRRVEAEQAADQKKLRDLVSALDEICYRWREFLNEHNPRNESLDTLRGEWTAAVNALGNRFRTDECRNRWISVDHDRNFAIRRGCEYGAPWTDWFGEGLSRARYDAAKEIVDQLLFAPITADDIRPAMEEVALRGCLTYLSQLLQGLAGVLPLEQRQSPVLPAAGCQFGDGGGSVADTGGTAYPQKGQSGGALADAEYPKTPSSAPTTAVAVMLAPDEFEFGNGGVASGFTPQDLLILRAVAPTGRTGLTLVELCRIIGKNADTKGIKATEEALRRLNSRLHTAGKSKPLIKFTATTTNGYVVLEDIG